MIVVHDDIVGIIIVGVVSFIEDEHGERGEGEWELGVLVEIAFDLFVLKEVSKNKD